MLLFQSLFVYIGLIILMTITSLWATQKHYKIRMIVPVLIFSITFGLRYGVGIDYYTYLQSYYDSPEIVQDYYEPGYVFLLDICKYISIGPELFFTLLAFLQIFFIYYAFNYLPRKAVVFLPVYLIFTGLAMAGFMNNIRQTIALALFIFSIHYIVEKRVLPFYIFCFLAFLFHKSAIILLIIYPIWRYFGPFFNNIKLQIIIMIVAFSLFTFIDFGYILSKFDFLLTSLGYERYLDDQRIQTTGFSLGYMITFIQYFLVIICSKNMKEFANSKSFNIMYDLFFIGVICEFIFAGSMILNRIAWYFNGFKIIVIPVFLYYLYKNLNVEKNLIYYILSLLILLFLFIRLMINSEDNTLQFVFTFQEHLRQIKDLQLNKYF